MKKRISIWLHGGLGTGHFDQGYPLLNDLLDGLCESFEIVVYSMFAPNKTYRNNKVVIRTAPEGTRNRWLRWMTLVRFFLADHRVKKFDVMIAFWGWPAGLIVTMLGKFFGIPSAIYLLGGDAGGVPSINYGILHKPLIRRIAFWAYNRCTVLMTVSQYQKDQLHSFGLTRAIAVIPWGANPSANKFRLRNAGSILHFIHVGHISPVKDQGTLIRAFAIINTQRPCELYMLGVDCMNGAMQKLCKELDIEDKVKFIGMVPYKEMPAWYEWADIMLHTSLFEGQSMALTEAAASGVLIAGTPVGLLYDLKEDGGIIAACGNYEELARKVLEILHDMEAWRSKVRSARQWSEAHTLHWTVRELTRHLGHLQNA